MGEVAIDRGIADEGDVIEIGSVELTFRMWAGDKQPETERIPRRRREQR